MKRLGLSSIAGLGVAGLLVVGTAYAQSGSTSGSQTTDPSQSGSASGSSTSTGSSSSTMGTGSGGSATEQHAMGSKNELTGTVEKFDRETKELRLQNSEKKLKVSESTRVMKDGQTASLSDIKEGDQVRASFSGSGDTLMVSRIDLMTAGSTGMGTGSTGTTGTGSTGSGSTGTDTGSTGTGSTGTDTGSTGTTGSGSSGTTPPPSKGY